MPHTKNPPANFLDRPSDFGLRAGAHPVSVRRDPQGTSAAWAQHLIVSRLRSWLPHYNARTVSEFIRLQQLPKTAWSANFRGARWMNLQEVAYLAQHAPDETESDAMMRDFTSAMRGQEFPHADPSALPRRQPTRPPARSARPQQRRNAKSGDPAPQTTSDTVWASLKSLATGSHIAAPTTLMLYARDDMYDCVGDPAGTATVVLPDPAGPPLPLIGSHAILHGDTQPGGRVRAVTLTFTPDEGPIYTARDATVNPDGHNLTFDPGE